MKRILIDLDVLTVAFWDRNKEALKFLDRVKKDEFEVYTPYSLLETLEKWKHIKLKQKMKNFYEIYSKKIISTNEALEIIEKEKIESKKVLEDLERENIKEEDATLVLIAAISEIDIVTFNRKHLRNKVNEINWILKKYELNEISIFLPNEI